MSSQFPFRNLNSFNHIIRDFSEQQLNSLEAINIADLYDSIFKHNNMAAKRYVEEFLYPQRDTFQEVIYIYYEKNNHILSSECIQLFDDYLKNKFVPGNYGTKEYKAGSGDNKILKTGSSEKLVVNEDGIMGDDDEQCNTAYMFYLINIHFKKLISSEITEKDEKPELVFQYNKKNLTYGVFGKIREYIKIALNRLPPAIIQFHTGKNKHALKSIDEQDSHSLKLVLKHKKK
jgi:hypothetical protein